MLKVINGETYTATDDDTCVDSHGREWLRWERADVLRKIRWAAKEKTRWVGKLHDVDAAACYMQAVEIEADAEEDLMVLDALWP